MKRKILITFTIFFLSSGVAFAQTDLKALVDQLQAQIKVLQIQVESLKAELNTSKKDIETSKQEINVSKKDIESIKEEIHFSKILKRGETGDEVRKLQEYLSQFQDIYPEGLVTGYYGEKTEAAVRKLQEKQGLEAVGVVGPKTLSRLNELVAYGGGQSGVVPPGLLTAPGVEKKVITEVVKEPVLLAPAPVVSVISSTTPIPQTTVSVPTTTSQPPLVSSTSSATYPKTSNECSSKYGSGWHIMDSSGRCFDLGMQNYRDVDESLRYCYNNFVSGCVSTSTAVAITTTPTAVTITTTTTTTTTTTATTTVSSADIIAPVISNVQATNINTTGATITWTTNEVSDSRVDYSSNMTANLDFESGIKIDPGGPVMTTSHSLSLEYQLVHGTTYRYRVTSRDVAGNIARSTEYTFTTLSTPTASNNSVLTATRLFPGQYDNTKYSLALSDPDGLGDILVNKAGGGFIWSGSPRNGNPHCPVGPINSGTVTLSSSDFPLSGYVIDCVTTGVQYPVSASIPSLTSGAILLSQNFASLLDALASALQNLQQLLK